MPLLRDSWVQQYTAGVWVRFFDWLGGELDFPVPRASEAVWQNFGISASIVPLCVATLGLLIALFALVGLCCCCSRSRAPAQRKPSSKPVICLALLSAVFLVVGVSSCLSIGGRSFRTAEEQLDNAAQALASARRQGLLLNSTGSAILKRLDNITRVCDPHAVATIKPQLDTLTQEVTTYVGEVQNYTEAISPLQEKLADVQSRSDDIKMSSGAALALPMILIMVACATIVSVVLMTRCFGGPGMARCNDCCFLRLGSSCISLAILLAATFSAAEVAFGIGSSAFCKDVDRHVLSYSESYFGEASIEFKAISHYISGVPLENPFSAELQQATTQVANASQTIQFLESNYADLLRDACQGWTAAPIVAELGIVQNGVQSCMDLLNYTSIYPYYQQTVHEDFCGTVITGLGWLSGLQVLAGFLCLPALAASARSFFTKLVVWRTQSDVQLLAADAGVYLAATA